MTHGGGIDDRRRDADALKREQQRAEPRQRAQGGEDVASHFRAPGPFTAFRGFSVFPRIREHALAERHLIEPVAAQPHVRRAERLGQPRGVDRIVFGAAHLLSAVVQDVGSSENARPQPAAAGRGRQAALVHLQPREHHPEIVGGAAEGLCA